MPTYAHVPTSGGEVPMGHTQVREGDTCLELAACQGRGEPPMGDDVKQSMDEPGACPVVQGTLTPCEQHTGAQGHR